jgi:hypothetical protein
MQNLTVAWLSRAHLARDFFVGIVTKPVKTAWARTSTCGCAGTTCAQKELIMPRQIKFERPRHNTAEISSTNSSTKFKKELRNSIVLELGVDLADLGLDANAFLTIDGI